MREIRSASIPTFLHARIELGIPLPHRPPITGYNFRTGPQGLNLQGSLMLIAFG